MLEETGICKKTISEITLVHYYVSKEIETKYTAAKKSTNSLIVL